MSAGRVAFFDVEDARKYYSKNEPNFLGWPEEVQEAFLTTVCSYFYSEDQVEKAEKVVTKYWKKKAEDEGVELPQDWFSEEEVKKIVQKLPR